MKVITVHDTPPYGHVPTCQISLTYLERKKCYGPHKKILFEKQLFDLEVKVHEGHYGMRHAALWSCTHIPNKYYLKNNYLTLRSKLYLVCWCMTIRRCVTYHNDLCGTLTFDLKVKYFFLNSIFLCGP
jgi:hypothetical protein